VADFDRAIAIEPEVASFFLWRGTALAKNSDDEGAVRDYEKAMRLNPGLVVAFNDTQSKDQHPLNSATATEPAPASGEFKKGTIDLGYNAKAMEDYAEAVKRAGVKSTAFFRPGAVYSGLCELDLQGKLIGNPMDSTAEGTVGKRNGSDYFTLKNPTKDMREADDQISQNPEAAKWYYSRARSYEQLGHDELAVKDLTRAIDLDQKNAMYFLARSFLYHKLSKKDLSEADLRSALDLDPSLPRLVSFEPPKNVKIEAKATQ
jgi:tetratricopeptide (TPR) repeat protein